MPYPGVSSHSSPASARSAPSPKAVPDTPLTAHPGSPSLASPTFGLSQVHLASPARPLDYTFGLASPTTPGAPLSAATSVPPDWTSIVHPQATGTSDTGDLLYFPANGGGESSMFYGSSPTTGLASLGPSFYSFDGGATEGSTITGASTSVGPMPSTPPWASFATPGLPFPGLDLLRNYDPAGGNPTFDESLWQTIDPSAFREPELPWTLGELPAIEENGQR
jgi:hypothetical protein